ncbi:ghrelin O-acyltransferase [Paramisgurnus dabryanus]|uniref:ghrelin O-acyltransferase n=1 Tax=Paramisgurnus dabryanus TaxID=90735 RepID=UPI0031F473EB
MVMDLLWVLLDGNLQLFYQFLNIPFALLSYYLARSGRLSVVNRFIYLALGGIVLAAVTMGPYSVLLFISSGFSLLLIRFLDPTHIYRWTLGLQMCWQTFWHSCIQYQQYWLQETPDSRLLLAVSALMLMTQRVSSLSLDLQEGLVGVDHHSGIFVSFLSYLLCFPSLLGGPLCDFNTFVESVRRMSRAPPLTSCLGNLASKTLQVLVLVLIKYALHMLLKSNTREILGIWILALLLKTNYYAHWKVSECVNNAAGMGLRGYRHAGKPSWDGMSDGNPWLTELSCRPSVFAREWNRTTAAWLRRIIFQRCNTSPLLVTFGFSAWWHGLHPGQILGFLMWAATVHGDYKLHRFLKPKLTSPWRKRLYVCLSWALTQLTIACVVICVELQSFKSVGFLCSSYITVFPFLSVLFIMIL